MFKTGLEFGISLQITAISFPNCADRAALLLQKDHPLKKKYGFFVRSCSHHIFNGLESPR
jgi:hypothetical protein